MKKLILVIAVVALFFWARFNYQQKFGQFVTGSTSNPQHPVSTIFQKIADEDNNNFIQYTYKKGETALNLLMRTTETVKIVGEGENTTVLAIKGRYPDEKKHQHWAFYLNGKPSDIGAGVYLLKNGDKIEWRIDTSGIN